jgi:hypothetical protein
LRVILRIHLCVQNSDTTFPGSGPPCSQLCVVEVPSLNPLYMLPWLEVIGDEQIVCVQLEER